MANNVFQVKRTNVSGRTPNTTGSYGTNSQYIAAGEFALNMADGILYSSNGSAVITVGANLVNQRITNSLTVDNTKSLKFQTVNTSVASFFTHQNDDNFVFYSTNTAYQARAVWGVFANSITSNLQIYIPLQLNSGLVANSSLGTAGQVLTTNGTSTYWSSVGGTVTSVATGNGMTGGPITISGTVSILANTGIVANATGTYVNATYIGTISANNASFLGGTAAASYVQNTDSRTLSGNLVISGTYFNPSSNTILLGNSTQRWVLSANTGNFSGAVSGITTLAAGNTTITGFINVSSSGYISGDLGIGTVTPNNKFEVFGNATRIASRAAANTSSTFIEVQASDYWSASNFTGTSIRQFGGSATGNSVVTTIADAGLGALTFQNGTTGLILTNGGTPLVFATTSVERMRINPSGNVGIGTANPALKLDVSGSGLQGVRVNSTDTTGSNIAYFTAQHGSGTSLQLRAGTGYTFLLGTGAVPLYMGTNSATHMTILASGNVGIANTTPDATLAVTGTANISGNVIVGGTITAPTVSANVLLITASNDSITYTTSVDGWYFDNSFSVSAQETEPRDLHFSSDGTKMYVLGNAGDDITVYSLSSAWNVATAAVSTTFSVSAQEITATGLYFKPDGTKFYVVGQTNDTVYQYALSVAWDISTATYESKSFSITAQETAPNAVYFSSDGTAMFIVGSTSDTVFQYTLGTAWDVSTASYSTKSLSVTAYDTVPEGIAFNSTGTKLWVLGATYARLIEYNLSVAWDISTATFSNFSVVSNLGIYDVTGASGLYVNLTQGFAYITDYGNDRVFQLKTNLPSTKLVGTKWVVEPDLLIKSDLMVDKNARFNGNMRVVGTGTLTAASIASLTVTGAATFSTAAGAIAIGTSQTTGAITAGGTTQTGAIQIGRSTANQTIAIANGATTSGNVKTLEIGTLGAAGSQTNITVGSSLSNTLITVNANNTLFSGAVNGAVLSTGTTFIANSTQVTFAVPISANGSTGTAGYVLTSNGATGSPYWAATSGGGGVYMKGGSATVGSLGSEGQNLFRVNANTLNFNTTIAAGENAQATGPIAVAAGITLTVETGARVSIV